MHFVIYDHHSRQSAMDAPFYKSFVVRILCLFLLNDKQEIRFRKMLEEADCTKNISRFILSRLFG